MLKEIVLDCSEKFEKVFFDMDFQLVNDIYVYVKVFKMQQMINRILCWCGKLNYNIDVFVDFESRLGLLLLRYICVGLKKNY